MNQSGAFLGKAFLIAVGLIFLVLVMEFNSVLLPAIIMFSILLSLIGVFWGLILCGMRFGIIMTGVGVISLAGVVVNNAIVLIDCTLQLRAQGLNAVEASVRAGRLRLRPVFLTAATTVLGLIPMAMGFGLDVRVWPPKLVVGAESSTWWAPMAIVVIFGLTFATVLTLVVVPAMYCTTDSWSQKLKRMFRMAEGSKLNGAREP